jgi:hypothetical protein
MPSHRILKGLFNPFRSGDERRSLLETLSLEEFLNSFEDRAYLLGERLTGQDALEFLKTSLLLVRQIFAREHLDLRYTNPEIKSSGKVDELSNEKLIRRPTTRRSLRVPDLDFLNLVDGLISFTQKYSKHYSKQDFHDLVEYLNICFLPESGRTIQHKSAVRAQVLGKSQAQLFYFLRQKSKAKRR